MAEQPRAALFKALKKQLENQGIWGANVFADQVPPNYDRPYVVYSMAAGGEANWSRDPDWKGTITIKVVSNDFDEAVAGSARLEGLLNDVGQYDVSLRPGDNPAGKIDAGPDWLVQTSTKGQEFHYTENVQGARQIYHDGARYDFYLGRV